MIPMEWCLTTVMINDIKCMLFKRITFVLQKLFQFEPFQELHLKRNTMQLWVIEKDPYGPFHIMWNCRRLMEGPMGSINFIIKFVWCIIYTFWVMNLAKSKFISKMFPKECRWPFLLKFFLKVIWTVKNTNR